VDTKSSLQSRKHSVIGSLRSSKRSIQTSSSEDTLIQEENDIRIDTRFDSKKDSGYGSQGILKVDKFKVQVCADVHFSISDSEDEESKPEPIVRPKLSRRELKYHYDVYEACKHVRL